MRFSLISVAITLATYASAIPFGDSESPASSSELDARDDTATGLDNAHEFVIRGIDPETFDVFARAMLDARAKYRPAAYTLTTTKMIKGTKLTAKDLDAGKRAMCGAGVTAGSVMFGWKGEGKPVQDPVNHFTIQPTAGPNSSKGKIRVHKNGSWTQGPGGKISGKPCK